MNEKIPAQTPGLEVAEPKNHNNISSESQAAQQAHPTKPPAQIYQPSRIKNRHRTKKFGCEMSVELDTISSGDLRDLVEPAIQQHGPPSQLRSLKSTEDSERARLGGLVKKLKCAWASRSAGSV